MTHSNAFRADCKKSFPQVTVMDVPSRNASRSSPAEEKVNGLAVGWNTADLNRVTMDCPSYLDVTTAITMHATAVVVRSSLLELV